MTRKVFEKHCRRAVVEYVENAGFKFWRLSLCGKTWGWWWRVNSEKTYAKEATAIKNAEKWIADAPVVKII